MSMVVVIFERATERAQVYGPFETKDVANAWARDFHENHKSPSFVESVLDKTQIWRLADWHPV